MALQLLRGHIGERAGCLLEKLRAGAGGHEGQAKIREPNLLVGSEQQILRLEVAVNQFLLMDILQGRSHLLDVGDNDLEGQPRPLGVELPQGATWRILHD